MDWKRKLRQVIVRQQEIENELAEESKKDETKENNVPNIRIRRLSALVRTAGGGRGAVNKWKSKVHHRVMLTACVNELGLTLREYD